jgi:Holliday junction resolvasome RuvABC endonuclease subunit
MKIAGIDPSMNSTGKCIMELDDENFSIKSISFYGYHTTKVRSISGGNVCIDHIGTKFTSLNMFERQELAYDILSKGMEDVKHIAFEGYAFGKKGTSSIIQLAEFNGGMKKFFYDQGKGLVIYPPTTIKHFATGSGAADKIAMVESFKKIYPELYPPIFNEFPQYESPHADLCDAFWICETLRNHLMYDVLGSERVEKKVAGLLEYKASKKSSCIVESTLFIKKKN